MKPNSTMKKTILAVAALLGGFTFAHAQVTFTGVTTGLQAISSSSYADCAADMDQDGLDDIVRVTSSGIYIDYQNPDGSFTPFFQAMSLQNLPSWSICAADIDDNGYTDLCLGAGNACSFVYASDDGQSFVEDAHPEYIFSQRTTFADIDNDGNLDAFVCHDVDQSHAYRNTNGILDLDISLLPTLDAGGNYAAIWVDYDNDNDIDLYITKCRGGAAVGDPQRINLLYRNNADGTFTSVGPEANMDDGDQSWATVFEDFDNDGDFDAFTVNHAFANRFMRNNGDGTFTDIVASTGINASDLGAWNCDAGDFDNNGFIDIFSEMANEMYWNNGDGTFTGTSLSFNSGGIGDFNNDGFLDVIKGNTRYMNATNNNNWVKFDLEGIITNKEAIGARVEIYGSWGIQVREVRAGESFDPSSSTTVHFGLGAASAIDQVVVKWPSGMVTSIQNPAINSTINILESSCILDPVAISVNGPTQICQGETLVLTAPEGSSYAWNNGVTTQENVVSTSGNYSVYVFDTEGCVSMSNVINVDVITEETPLVAAQGETIFCQGGSVILTSTIGDNYNWSDGTTGSPSIEVTESGVYHVNVDGTCSGLALQSNSIEITVLNAAAPVAADVQIGTPGSVDLTATGSNIEWFASETSTEVLATGNSFTTPIVDTEMTFWAQATSVHPGATETGGKTDISGNGGLPSQGGVLYFNASEPFTLKQVTCYIPAEGSAGNRTIQLMDAVGTVIAQSVVNLPVGTTTVDLNFEVPVGNQFQLGCMENNLFRNNGGVSYPYAIGTVGQITGSTFGASYYYYFYDWKVEKAPMECVSERVPVSVAVVGIDELSENPLGLSIYPNPVEDVLTISSRANLQNAIVRVVDATGRLVIEQNVTSAALSQSVLDVNSLEAGVYHLIIVQDGIQSEKEFIKF